MLQYSQFIAHHWVLFLTLFIIILAILLNELYTKKRAAKAISPQEAVNFINNENAVVIDIRDLDSYQKGHILHAIHVSPKDIDKSIIQKHRDTPLILVCARGLQANTFATQLHQQGFATPMSLAGGISAWQQANLPLVKGK